MIYSIIANSTMADVMPDVAPLGDEPSVLSGPDKFLNTDLAKILKDKGIQTVIVTGTASNGAVLFTGARAAFRGMNVIVPVDRMSAVEPYADFSSAKWGFRKPLASTAYPRITRIRPNITRFFVACKRCFGIS